jgi:hypothetical protein
MKWLNSGKAGKKTPGGGYDPSANFPDVAALTPYPNLQTLPDGSEVPDTPASTFQRTSASLLDPKKFADLEGQKAYQPTIDALTGQQNRLQAGIGQANSMLDTAYGSAADASARGAQTVANSNAQANQSLTDLAARLAQVAGGDPTAAAAVGQASADTQTANTRLAGVAAQSQSDQAAAAQRDLGTAKLAYKSSTDSGIADLAQKVAAAKLGGSQDQGKAIEEALGFNSSQRTAALNRDVSSLEARTAAALAGPQITAGKLGNVVTRAGLVANKNTSAINDWKNVSDANRQNFTDKLTQILGKTQATQAAQLLDQGKKPVAELALVSPQAYAGLEADLDAHYNSKGGPIENPAATFRDVAKALHAESPDSSPAAIKALATRYVSNQLAAWNREQGAIQAKSGKTWKQQPDGSFALVKVKK